MFRINDVVKYNGVNCTIIDIRDENGSVLYDLKEVNGDGEYNDVTELMLCKNEMTQFATVVENFLDEMYDRGLIDFFDEPYKELDGWVSRLRKRYCNGK